MKFTAITTILTFLMLLLLLGCQTDSLETENSAAAEGPIVIGVSLPLTGRRSDSGQAVKNGYEVWAKLVNDEGGLLGRQVELLILDNEGDPDDAVADYEKLITEETVDLILGPNSSFLVIPTSEVAAEYEYAFVEPSGGAPEVFNRGLTNLFLAQPARAARQADPFALYILGLPPDQRPQTFATISTEDPFALSIIDRLKELFIAGDLELVYETTHPQETQNFSEIADEVMARNHDMIIGGTQLEDAIGQINAYRAVGYQPRVAYFTGGPSLPEPFREALGPATEGIFSSAAWFPETTGYQNEIFVAQYAEMFGGSLADVPEAAANAFTVGQVLQQAIESINTIDNTALIEELHSGTYETVVGSLNFDDVGAPRGSYMLLQWQSDKFVIVGPPDRAEVDPLPPPKTAW